MDIFESLENLPVSEGCFEDIIGIVEEYINELKNQTVADVYNKRYDQYKNATLNAVKNQSPENLKNYIKASNKLENHVDLGSKRDARKGTEVYKNVSRESRVNTTLDARKKYHNALDNYKKVKSNYPGAWGQNAIGGPESDIDDVEKAEQEARKAKKAYHNIMDYNNTVNIHQNKDGKGDINYLKNHLEYQNSHDKSGNRK